MAATTNFGTEGIDTTYIPSMGILVMGPRHERVAEAASLDDAKVALTRLGYYAQIAWREGQYGSWNTYTARI